MTGPRCEAAADGFPYEHFHRCTKRYDHRLHDEPDNNVHLCSCGAKWREMYVRDLIDAGWGVPLPEETP